MIVRGFSIGECVKYWVKLNIENRIEEGSIKVYFNVEIKEIKEIKVIIFILVGDKVFENDFVVVFIGY